MANVAGNPLDLKPGVKIRVTQRIDVRTGFWTCDVEGEILSCGPERSESWFARNHTGVVWLNRIRLRKPDGEITTINIDQNTQVTVLPPA
jgi:hypothetical protein